MGMVVLARCYPNGCYGGLQRVRELSVQLGLWGKLKDGGTGESGGRHLWHGEWLVGDLVLASGTERVVGSSDIKRSEWGGGWSPAHPGPW